ncbi:acetylornithine deacetylase [Hansschlegelia plantiphila]|uniref:Acetylornithine deacetylase n=1 Tax=Hansschlegelia plantiphila TaxID=374655 RepID=A0A9W6J443_9HYPH|nr:acetylornithine deacetylase [Hansschlegelia plantiphila]GLK68933.1 acetylornithine deacetylase [Hansschlegelia plantiphila]
MRSRTVEILDRLIAFPTVSRDSNLGLIGFVRELLSPLGARLSLTHDDAGGKANLHAVIGPAGPGGVMLSGHTDVVPVEGQAWTTDPFRLTPRDDRLLGRGTCDMKGFIACALAAVESAAARPLKRPLHLALSYDEEIGCVGVRRMIEQLVGADLPAFCIVGEPTGLETVVAHKGKVAGRISCRGRECHSALAPEGLNAIHLAADMVGALRREQDVIARDGPRDDDYAVPFSTVHAGVIRGGTALNIVPRDCAIDFEIRHLPADEPRLVLDRLFAEAGRLTREAEARFPGAGVSIEILNAYPGLATDPGAEIVPFARRLSGGEGQLRKIAFGTEGGLFTERLGVPTVVCGPGDIRDAHQPDEYVSRAQLAACDAMLARLIEELAA